MTNTQHATQHATAIGFVIAWTSPATVKLADLRNALASSGFPQELAADLRPLSLLARTAGHVARQHTGGATRMLARPTANQHARQLTSEQESGDRLDYSRETSLTVNGGIVTASQSSWQAEADTASQTVTDTRTANDVTRIVQSIVQGAGSDLIPVRPQGGAYFVPQAHTSLLDRLDRMLSGVGGTLTRFACTLGHGSSESVAQTVADYLLNLIQELKDEVAELPGEIKPHVKARRIARVGELRGKLSQYSTLLGAMDAKVQQAMTDATATLTAKLGDL